MSASSPTPPTSQARDAVIVFALNLEATDAARETLLGLCRRYGQEPLILDAEIDPLFAEHVRDPKVRAHFPLLCVRGQLIGGLPVVSAMESLGKLQELLELDPARLVPRIALSVAAAEQLAPAITEEDPCVRLVIGPTFEHELALDREGPSDVVVELGALKFVLDAESASRADGLSIDWIDDGTTRGFRMDNPSRPEPVESVQLDWLASAKDRYPRLWVIDARTAAEFGVSHLDAARHLDSALIDELERLARDTPLLFYCTNGLRSKTAAERYREAGYLRVFWLAGGLNSTLAVPPASET